MLKDEDCVLTGSEDAGGIEPGEARGDDNSLFSD